MAHDGGEERHDYERAEGSSEDYHTWVSHGEYGGDEECFIADFGEYDHEEGLEESLGAGGRVEGRGVPVEGFHDGVKVEHWVRGKALGRRAY